MFFHGEALLAPSPTSNLEDHPSSAVRDYLFNIFAATLHIGGRSSIRNLRTCRAVVTGTHLSRLAEPTLRIFKQDRLQWTYNVTMRHVRVTIVAVEKQELLHTLSVRFWFFVSNLQNSCTILSSVARPALTDRNDKDNSRFSQFYVIA